MKAKLIKIKREYELYNGNEMIGSTYPYQNIPSLSLKNCQAIERGYDLDELFQREIDELMFTGNLDDPSEYRSGMYKGAKILIELMGDKKFTEEEVRKVIEIARNGSMQEQHNGYGRPTELRFVLDNISSDEIIQSLQQKEWEVEIEMEKYGFCEGCKRAGMWHCAHADTCGNAIEAERPKLDADGCLILKRV